MQKKWSLYSLNVMSSKGRTRVTQGENKSYLDPGLYISNGGGGCMNVASNPAVRQDHQEEDIPTVKHISTVLFNT